MYKKIIIWTLFFAIAIILLVAISFQVRYEQYIKMQKEDYSILEKRKRKSYKPAFYYYIESVLLNKKEINKESLNLLRENSQYKIYKFSYIKDEYILECYYSKEEKQKYISEKK